MTRDTIEPATMSRRSFFTKATAAMGMTTSLAKAAVAEIARSSPKPSSYLDLQRVPERVTAYSGLDHALPMVRSGSLWHAQDIEIGTEARDREVSVHIFSPQSPLTHIHLRWEATVSPTLLCLGDAWERSYGELAWRPMVPDRVMPWYFLTYDGDAIHGYGVETGGSSLAFWQVDLEGISLWLNVSNGGSGVLLGNRRLTAASIVTREGQREEPPMMAARSFCQRLCAKPRPLQEPVFGSNDWYYAYGDSSPSQILHDADLVSELRPSAASRPFTVVDEGWENTSRFPDMARLAEEIREREVRPGIWLRPLRAPSSANPAWLLPAARFGERASRAFELAYDPTVPDALAAISQRIREIASWKYDLLKHDFSTYDLLGQWGFEMGPSPSLAGWSFHDRTRTNAEIILDFYRNIRESMGEESLILACNTMGHVGAGIFDLQRTGDDTSGKIWERTRKMGVNTIAYRLPQHQTFFALDPDCVPVTQAIPWDKTKQWLNLVAQTGTVLFVSAAQAALGTEQKHAIAEAFALTAARKTSAEPYDWFHDTTPERWVSVEPSPGRKTGALMRFDWCSPEGAYPFQV